MIYRFREYTVRDDMMEAILRWIQHGIEPGDFLRAVINNDLREAIGRADDDNMRNLPAIVGYFYNEAPSSCWGSPEKAQAWAALFTKEAA